VNLAYLSASDNLRTLLWDLDPQGAATYLFRIRARVKGGSPKLVQQSRPLLDAVKATDFEGLDLLPADFTYRHMDIDLNERPKPERTLRRLLQPLEEEYDLVVLDTPPSMSLVSENVLNASDVVLVPLIPTVLSVRTFEQLSSFVAELDGRVPVIRGFFSMVDRRRRLHRDILANLPTQHPQVSSIAVPAASIVEQMAVRRAPVTAFAPRSPAAIAYNELWAEITDLLAVRSSTAQ
jgi:cellulose biosynthesis protein BcsQ